MSSKKAFFSVAILVFAFLIFMLFVDYKQSSKEISFDDSPRLFALKMEEAYNILDKSLSYNYIKYKENKDCNTVSNDGPDYFEYVNDKIQLNEFCDSIGTINNGASYIPNQKYFDANYTFIITCNYSHNSDFNLNYSYSNTITFHKRYQSYLVAGNKCQYVLSDLDTMNQYFGLIK